MSIPEAAPVGSVVGRIWAKDRDVGVNAEMEYSIIDGDGRDTFDISTDPTNLFGIITVKRVRRPSDEDKNECLAASEISREGSFNSSINSFGSLLNV